MSKIWEKWWKIITNFFFGRILKNSKNQKTGIEVDTSCQNGKMIGIYIFDQISNQNWFLNAKFSFSEPVVTQKPLKICSQQHGDDLVIRISKTHWPSSYFSEAVRTIWHDPSIDLDLSCSYFFSGFIAVLIASQTTSFFFHFCNLLFFIKSSPILIRPRRQLRV